MASQPPLWRSALKPEISQQVIHHQYTGSGTEADPFIVFWLTDDPQNPFAFTETSKWIITIIVSLATLAVSLISSAYAGGLNEIINSLHTSQELAFLGISVFVVGFAVGPLFWAPLSETYGRRPIFIFNAISLTAFTAGAAASSSIHSLIIFRFLAGSFGSAPMAISGGVIADTFSATMRGLVSGLYCAAPFMGPALGPVIGGYLAQEKGWQAVQWLLVAFSGAILIIMSVLLPETYAPVLLRQRAAILAKKTGHVYVSKMDSEQGKVQMAKKLGSALSRPWILLCWARKWDEGTTGLTFVGVMIGILCGSAYTIPMYYRYKRKSSESSTPVPPEARLADGFLGAITLPIGLFMFAWTNSPSVHWLVSVAAGVPFGFGMLTVFLAVLNYLVDAYTIYAASVLASTTLLRSLFGAAFPLFTGYMYEALGIHWASSVPAFLALACLPIPFMLSRYGSKIREKCHYAAEASAIMRQYLESLSKAPIQRNSAEQEKIVLKS
ncbi:unnamed protein product [Penicillium manginii]